MSGGGLGTEHHVNVHKCFDRGGARVSLGGPVGICNLIGNGGRNDDNNWNIGQVCACCPACSQVDIQAMQGLGIQYYTFEAVVSRQLGRLAVVRYGRMGEVPFGLP